MEKTEKPTPKKIQDARKKGQVFSSNDIVIAVNIIVGTALLIYMVDGYSIKIRDKINLIIASIANIKSNSNVSFQGFVDVVLEDIILMVLPFLIIMSIASIAAKLFQSGIILSLDPIMPKLSNISPMAFIKKVFSKKAVFEFLKSIAKVAIISAVVSYFLLYAIVELIDSSMGNMVAVIAVFKKYLILTVISCTLPFLVIAFLDFIIQKRAYIKQLMMSMYEIKKEFKESEGDPEFKGKRKSFFMEIINSGSSAGTIVNPTHFAVIFSYNKIYDVLPIIVAKGVDQDALDLIEESRASNIPIFLCPKLARDIYSQIQSGMPITAEFLDPIAQIITKIDMGKYKYEVMNNAEDIWH